MQTELSPVKEKLGLIEGRLVTVEGKVDKIDGLVKDMKQVKGDLIYLRLKADNTSIFVANLKVDMVDVLANTKETLERTRKAETNIDYFVNEQKKEGSAAKINFHHIEHHKDAILIVAEKTTDKNTYDKVKNKLEE